MSRYIDADKLDDLITQLNNEGRDITRVEYKRLDNILSEMPTADVRENVHGKWLEKEIIHNHANAKISELQSARCSVCNKYHTTPYMYSFYNYNFCPNCGADNREVEK